jgi:hypothetical protein
LSGWVVVVLAGYLAYSLTWLVRMVVRGPRTASEPRRHPARSGSADSTG